MKAGEQRYFKDTPRLYNKGRVVKDVHELLQRIEQSASELDELHIIRNEIVHLFLPGSGLYHSEVKGRWLIPKPEPGLKQSMQYYQEMIESDGRDTWFDQNPGKSDCIEGWSQKILSWLVASISKGWEHLSQQPKEWR